MGAFGTPIRAPAPDNSYFCSSAEAMQALLGAAREQLELVVDMKLRHVLGDEAQAAKPATAPFALAGVAIRAAAANVEAVRALLAAMLLAAALPPEDASIANELDFQLASALKALRDAEAVGGDWPGALASPDARNRAVYAALALDQTIELLKDRRGRARPDRGLECARRRLSAARF